MTPDLTLPHDPAGLLMWIGPWLILIGGLCIPATDGLLDFWTTRLQSKYGPTDPRAAISAVDQRLVSVYIVPPVVTAALYLFGLALGWVGFSTQWLVLALLLAIGAIAGKQGLYAVKEKVS